MAIRRLRPGEPNKDHDDTGYLLTNLDFAEHALWGDEKRFWIGEMFRDGKPHGDGLPSDQFQIRSEQVFQKLLWVVSLTPLWILEGAFGIESTYASPPSVCEPAGPI